MSSTIDNTDLMGRIYDYLSEHYHNIESIPLVEVHTVVQLWCEFINNEVHRVQVDARLDELRWLQKQYDNKPRDEWFKDPIPRRITKLERMKQDADMAINNTCEICHAYPMTVDCNNAGCDK